MILDQLIIGAGMSGLSLGLELKNQGKSFLIVEKSKGVGGRVATRRINQLGVDHGAPFLKSHPLLFDLMNRFNILEGKIADHGIYIDGGMTTLAKKMAEELPVIKDEKIVSISFNKNIWICKSENGKEYQAKTLVLTGPLPQMLELLNASQIDYAEKATLKAVTYTKGLLGIFLLDEKVLMNETLPENVHSVLSMQERELNPAAWVLRTSESFSELNFDKSDVENLSQIEKLFKECLKAPSKITHRELKKWRYVTPKSALPFPYLEVQKEMYLIGDSFLYPDIRGALLSAQALAENLS